MKVDAAMSESRRLCFHQMHFQNSTVMMMMVFKLSNSRTTLFYRICKYILVVLYFLRIEAYLIHSTINLLSNLNILYFAKVSFDEYFDIDILTIVKINC